MGWLDFFKFNMHLGTSTKPRPLPEPKEENDWEIPLRNYLELRTDFAKLCKDYQKALEEKEDLELKLKGIRFSLNRINFFDNISGVYVVTERDYQKFARVLESLKDE